MEVDGRAGHLSLQEYVANELQLILSALEEAWIMFAKINGSIEHIRDRDFIVRDPVLLQEVMKTIPLGGNLLGAGNILHYTPLIRKMDLARHGFIFMAWLGGYRKRHDAGTLLSQAM